MPSAGLPIENLMTFEDDEENRKLALRFETDAKHALKLGMFTEWLESFVGAWNATKDPVQASSAGIIEWDM
jgi:hypothetical protein